MHILSSTSWLLLCLDHHVLMPGLLQQPPGCLFISIFSLILYFAARLGHLKCESDYITRLPAVLGCLLIAFKSTSRPFLAWHTGPFMFWLLPSPTSSLSIHLPLFLLSPLTRPRFTSTVCYRSVLVVSYRRNILMFPHTAPCLAHASHPDSLA